MKVIGIAAVVVFAALWAIPLARAVSFFQSARDYFNETNSLDASNDLRFGASLLASYSLSIVAALVLGWLLSRRLHIAFVLPVVLLAFASVEVLWLRPESAIHLFPIIAPWRPAWISLAAVDLKV
jgi:hypothetical protein